MLNFALVGCGRIAKRHSELLGLHQIEGAQLVAICDKEEKKAKTIGTQFNIPYYTDIDQMLESEPIDVVSILTESGSHTKHVLQVAKYRKHIVVEKPMALTLEDADAIIQACDIARVKLFVVKQNRFNLPVQKLKEALDTGRFGQLVLGTVRVRWCRRQEYYDQDAWRGSWAMDGGVLANQASHHIDLLEWMIGGVESLFAKSITALVDIEVEDTAVATLKFRNGALGLIEATTATRPTDLEGSISILGERGTVEIAGFAMNEIKVWQFEEVLPNDKDIMENYSVNPPNLYGFGHQSYYDNVVDCIINDKQQLVDGLEGRRSLELITALYESIQTGKEVFLRFTKQFKLGQQ